MITTIQFKTLDDLFQFYNNHLFEGKLPECIVNMRNCFELIQE